MPEEDVADRLVSALSQLDAIAKEVTPDEALRAIDEATLEVFWRDWPEISAWARSLWRLAQIGTRSAPTSRVQGYPALRPPTGVSSNGPPWESAVEE
jgi:hypothetical protein